MNSWLDSWTTTRRLPRTFLAVKRFANRVGRADDRPDRIRTIPLAETMMILKMGKKAYRAIKGETK